MQNSEAIARHEPRRYTRVSTQYIHIHIHYSPSTAIWYLSVNMYPILCHQRAIVERNWERSTVPDINNSHAVNYRLYSFVRGYKRGGGGGKGGLIWGERGRRSFVARTIKAFQNKLHSTADQNTFWIDWLFKLQTVVQNRIPFHTS